MEKDTLQLINQLAQNYDLAADQALAAVGVLVKTALENCTDQERNDLTAQLPDVIPLAATAPPPPKQGLFGSLAKLGGERMEIITQTVTALKACGLRTDDLKPFAKEAFAWVEERGGEPVARIRERVTGEA